MSTRKNLFCRSCGRSIRAEARFCENCGAAQHGPARPALPEAATPSAPVAAQPPAAPSPAPPPSTTAPVVTPTAAQAPPSGRGSFRLPVDVPPVAVVLAAIVVVIGGIFVVQAVTGEERSTAAVCEVFETDGAALHDRFQERADSLSQGSDGDRVLGSIGELLAAPGRLAHLMAKMAAVAPKDIEPAFSALAESFGKIGDSAGANATNPIGALASSLALGAQIQGPWEEADRFLSEHCTIPA